MNICIKNEFLCVEVSRLGAELRSIIAFGHEFLWQGNEEIWSGRSPLLFPIVGRLKNDQLKYQNKIYKLTKHGFAKEKVFEVVHHSAEKAIFELKSNEETHEIYPFDFILRVTYSLNNDKLAVAYEVESTDGDTIFFSIGGHPGFQCEMGDELIFEKKETVSRLLMNSESYIYSERKFLNEERTIQITPNLFDEDALIFHGLKSDCVTLTTRNGNIVLCFNDAPYLGIWAKPSAPYVCIEPWFGVDDDINAECSFDAKNGIVKLEKDEYFKYSFEIQITKQ